MMCSTQARRRAGLRSFPGRLLQDQLVEREVGDRLAQRWFSVSRSFIRRT